MSYNNQDHVRRHWLTVPSVDTLMSSASSRLVLETFQPQRDCLCLIPLLAVRTNEFSSRLFPGGQVLPNPYTRFRCYIFSLYLPHIPLLSCTPAMHSLRCYFPE